MAIVAAVIAVVVCVCVLFGARIFVHISACAHQRRLLPDTWDEFSDLSFLQISPVNSDNIDDFSEHFKYYAIYVASYASLPLT